MIWNVHTESGSTYQVNTELMTLTRYAGLESAELRRDEAPTQLVAIDYVEVGEPARFLIYGLEPGVITTRTTTRVTLIERVDEQ